VLMHLHHIICIQMSPADKAKLLATVQVRMAKDGLDQRALAQRLSMSQGHLSKLLRGQFERRTRLVRELEGFASEGALSKSEARLVQACLRLAKRSPRHMHFVAGLMHLLDDISQRAGGTGRQRG